MTLGFVINWNKSCLTPTRKVQYLGFSIDSELMELSLPDQKVQKILELCQGILKEKSISIRQLSKLIGTLSASVMAVLPGPLHYRLLQVQKTKALLESHQSYDANITLPPEVRKEITWWTSHLREWNGKSVITPSPDLIITTDASKKGWGAICQQVATQGVWGINEKNLHINALELMAVLFAVKAYTKELNNCHIHVRVDNMTTMAHINRMGGTRSPTLIAITKDLWQYCLSNKITITAEHLPGVLNTIADRWSRVFLDRSNWKLDPSILPQLERNWGVTEIDLFVDRLTTQKAKYVSWRPDPGATAVDAFSIKWNQTLAYAFPPFNMINQTLAKTRKEKATIILITPVWQAQSWYPVLLEMAIEDPILLPQLHNLLTSPQGVVHPLIKDQSLTLAAWKICGKNSEIEVYHRKLPTSYWKHDGQEHNWLTKAPGTSGLAGVMENKLIHFKPLWQT